MNYEIGSRIRKYREAKKITQKQLAALIGVTGSRVSNWEQGINRPDVDILSRLCNALSVSPSELLDIHLDCNEFSAHEHRLIEAYREHSDLRHAVDILLGIDNY